MQQQAEESSATDTLELIANIARSLAHAHITASAQKRGARYSLSVAEQKNAFDEIYRRLASLDSTSLDRLPAADWLLDNDYIVQEAIKLVTDDTPKDNYRKLPILTAPPQQGQLRALLVADQLLNTCGLPLDLGRTAGFLNAYQEEAELCLGELWALPNLMRLITLQRLADIIRTALDQTAEDTSDSTDFAALIAGHVVTLRELAAADWLTFVESVSLSHRVLTRDPASRYAAMDEKTRNRYRHRIEVLARRTGRSETQVARQAVTLADDRRTKDAHIRETHVGYFLLDQGQKQLIATLNRRRTWIQTTIDGLKRCLPGIYLGSILVGAMIILWPLLSFIAPRTGWPLFAAAAISWTIIAITVSVNTVNWVIGFLRKPMVLPKMDFSAGVPMEFRTVAVTPVLLGDPTEVDQVLQRMELNYLGNIDPALRFVLLTDPADADTQEMPEDEPRLAHAIDGIEALNRRYGNASGGPFFLFHRGREYNPVEGRYMAHERKRGKLAEFNRFLLGESEFKSRVLVGSPDQLIGARFVITVDADTQLTPGAAPALIGTLAHPLNLPVCNEKMTAGYSIIQPRLTVYPQRAGENLFTRAFAGDMVLDLYTHAVSDIYQDLFGTGIFAGKGIYDVAAFESCVAGRVPDNAILSHDLFEGLHGRVGLATDIVLFEDFPDNLVAYAKRAHRWIRGDWQLVPWLLPRVPSQDGRWLPNRFSLIGVWKLLDNLRRSLYQPAVLLALLLSWTWLPGASWLWTLGILLATVSPIALGSTHAVGAGITQAGTLRAFADQVSGAMRREVMRWLYLLIMLPYNSVIALDAAGRTLWRVLVSRRHLLQWVTASQSDRTIRAKCSQKYYWAEIFPAPTLAAITAVTILATKNSALLSAGPFLIAWALAPAIAYWSTQKGTVNDDAPPLTESERRQLRAIALRTWLFFEQFVSPDFHWLPPDNHHEAPETFTSHRTSPTNIGLMLLASLTAYDLGHQTISTLIPRLRDSFSSMRRLARFRGHLYNWYRVDNLRALEPRYVSTVDSGNLVGSLITLRAGLLEMLNTPVSLHRQRDGVVDRLHDLLSTLNGLLKGELAEEIFAAIEATRKLLESAETDLDILNMMSQLEQESLPDMQQRLLAVAHEDDSGQISAEDIKELRRTFNQLRNHLRETRHEANLLPWLGWSEDVSNGSIAVGSGPTLRELPEWCAQIDGEFPEARQQQLRQARDQAAGLIETIEALIREASGWIEQTDFGFLYDPRRYLMRVGYTVTSGEYDSNYYDLLASEARLASYIAIAKGDVPEEHWLHLGRPFTLIGNDRALISWSATAFEYFMPQILMRSPPHSLLTESCQMATQQQMNFGKSMLVPWGISESGYYQLDKQAHYQYRAFGIPRLGLRVESSYRVVISPYASALALPFAPHEVVENLRNLIEQKMMGEYGLFEAVDFGNEPADGGRKGRIVRSYMSHHQGMILAALGNALCGDRLVNWFHSDPQMASLSHLLYEQVPNGKAEPIGWRKTDHEARPEPRHHVLEKWRIPDYLKSHQLKVLSNGHYQALLSHSGISGSFWDGLCLLRWQQDPCDVHGSCLFLQDLESGLLWSAAARPIPPSDPADCDTRFAPHMAEFHRRDHGLHVTTTVTVAADDDIEIHRVRLSNDTDRRRSIRLTSYAEPVLTAAAGHERHPAFSKLFIDARIVDGILLVHRRRREASESPVYVAHAVTEFGGFEKRREYQTDRRAFLGRGGTVKAPAQLTRGPDAEPPERTDNLDPLLSASVEVELPPRATTSLVFLFSVARSQTEALQTMQRYQSLPRIDWALQRAEHRSQQLLGNLGILPGEVPEILSLLSGVLAADPKLRELASGQTRLNGVQSALWSHGISGDLPVLLLNVRGFEDVKIAEQLVRAHIYWDMQQVAVDLILLDSEIGGYAQPTRTRLGRMLEESRSSWRHYTQGNIFIVPAMELTSEDRQRLLAAAWLVVDPNRGSISDQLAALNRSREELPPLVPVLSSPRGGSESTPELPRPEGLLHDNGFGGFSADGDEYVIFRKPGQPTPAPWCNVIANSGFGFVVSDSGAMCSWAGNSGEHRLTPWFNDPVSEPSGEAIFIRDEETGDVWSPTPEPMSDGLPYEIRHGAGYSTFQHLSHGLEQKLTVLADPSNPVKISALTLKNLWQRERRVTVTCYVEWVLGVSRETARPYIVSDWDATVGALFASNSFAPQPQGAAFLAASEPIHGMTTDRQEFLGLDGDWRHPAGLYRIGLSDNIDAVADPCAALQIHLNIEPGGVKTVHFLLGEAQDKEQAVELIKRYREPATPTTVRQQVDVLWNEILGELTVNTPDSSLNLMVNRWLLYQTLACRIWGRSAQYQSGGGFGFRDQLQDVMALCSTMPELARAQILRAASVQFQQGDVLHWWHENPLRGVRTRFSDDKLWLPFVTAHYVRVTGDVAILEEQIAFLDAPPLADEEDERYAEYASTPYPDSLIEHCRRAIESASGRGKHGLPLIGSGDWNDGLNRVGIKGRGESVWLGWFLTVVYRECAYLYQRLGQSEAADDLMMKASKLVEKTDEQAWDGDWYIRAYDDDGESLGSVHNDECSIELIAQTWAVLAQTPNAEHAARAMQAVEQYLMLGDGIVRLLTPPFQQTESDPGYIRGYPPGVRENGAQYSHAAVWAGWAFGASGDGDRALDVFHCIDPVSHSDNNEAAVRYRVEPYAVAADIYSVPPYQGRGGWTWYTGASGWSYRLAVEVILGIRQRGELLEIDPCLPAAWPGYQAHWRIGQTLYRIEVKRSVGAEKTGLYLNGQRLERPEIPVDRSGGTHEVMLLLDSSGTSG